LSFIGHGRRSSDEAQHDWVRIFSSLGVLPHAIQIGNFTRLVAWAGMVGTLAWFAWRGREMRGE